MVFPLVLRMFWPYLMASGWRKSVQIQNLPKQEPAGARVALASSAQVRIVVAVLS